MIRLDAGILFYILPLSPQLICLEMEISVLSLLSFTLKMLLLLISDLLYLLTEKGIVSLKLILPLLHIWVLNLLIRVKWPVSIDSIDKSTLMLRGARAKMRGHSGHI